MGKPTTSTECMRKLKKKQRKQKKNYRKREIDICKDLRIK